MYEEYYAGAIQNCFPERVFDVLKNPENIKIIENSNNKLQLIFLVLLIIIFYTSINTQYFILTCLRLSYTIIENNEFRVCPYFRCFHAN